MKKIVILLILIIGMISFGNNYQNNSELEEEVKKVINNFNQTEKDKLFSEFIKEKLDLKSKEKKKLKFKRRKN